jgi:tetratricopeptide (TPR) repeat protein
MCKKIADRVPSRKERLLAALAYVAVGVLTTAILAGTKLIVERSMWGRESEVWVFGLLQGSLSNYDPENPVVVIDISNVSEDSQVLIRTVKEIVEQLKKLDKRPIAVAVDVDFSPSGAISNDASEFFDACLKKSPDDVPIYLAVGDNKSAAPDEWLGLDKYRELAAAVAINRKDTRWVPIWVQASNQTEKLKTLNYSLALEYRRRLPGPPSWIGWAVDRTEEGRADTRDRSEAEADEIILNYGERLVNYSKLETIKMVAKKDIDAQSVRNNRTFYSGKLVIIGDVGDETPAKDLFPVESRQDNEAGSLMLASATYTLVKEPLFEFKSRVKLILDLLIASVITIMVAFIRYRNPFSFSWVGRQAIFIYVSIFVVAFAGFLLVRLTGIMWLDFLLVAFALFLHPKVERLIHWIVTKSKPRSGAARQPPAVDAKIPNTLISLLAITLMMTATARAQRPEDLCQQRVAAIARELKLDRRYKREKRSCRFRESDKDSWHALSGADMLKKMFRAGQHLQCDKGCTLVIFLCGKGKDQPVTYFETRNVPGWYTVINAYRMPRRIFDPNRETPAKNIKWATLRPANPRTSGAELAAGQIQTMGRVSGAVSRGILGSMAGGASTRPMPSPDTLSSRAPARAGGAETQGNIRREEEERSLEHRFIELLDKGNAQRDAKDYSAAEQNYSLAAKLRPIDSRPFYGLGNVYADEEKWKEAENAYQHAVAIGVDYPEVYLALALILLDPREGTVSADRLSQAETYLWVAAGMQPQNEKTYDLLETLLERRRASSAEREAVYRRVLRLYPQSVETNLRLSALLHRSERQEEAKKYLLIAEKAASNSQELLKVAEIFESRNRYNTAERLIRRSLTLNPGDSRALLILGLILLDKEHYAEAAAPLQLAATGSPNDFAPRYLLGIAEMRIGNLDEAERRFEEGATRISVGGDQLFATACWLGLLGDAYLTRGRTLDAVRVYERALRYDPEDLEISEQLSEIRARLKH